MFSDTVVSFSAQLIGAKKMSRAHNLSFEIIVSKVNKCIQYKTIYFFNIHRNRGTKLLLDPVLNILCFIPLDFATQQGKGEWLNGIVAVRRWWSGIIIYSSYTIKDVCMHGIRSLSFTSLTLCRVIYMNPNGIKIACTVS